MIVPIIVAICFGYAAQKAHWSVVAWVVVGAILTFIVSTVLANLGVLIVSGSLSDPLELEVYVAIRIFTAAMTIGIMVALGRNIRTQEIQR